MVPSPTVTLLLFSMITLSPALAQESPFILTVVALKSMALEVVRLAVPLSVTVLVDCDVKELPLITVLPPAEKLLDVTVMALSEVREEAPLILTVLFVCAVNELPLMVVPVAVRVLPVTVMALSDFRVLPLPRSMELPLLLASAFNVTELALIVAAPVLVIELAVIVRALSDVMLPALPPMALLVIVIEEAFSVELAFIVMVLPVMGRAFEAVKLLPVPSIVMELPFFISVVPLDLMVL